MNHIPYIVVVEDIDDDFATVVEAARRSGFKPVIQRATSGSECMQWLHASCNNPATWPSLVLIDIEGQNDDGRDTLVQIKTDAQLHVVPTVILTTSTHPRDIQFCYDHYANAYHIKPVNHVTHIQILERIFSYWINSAMQPTHRYALK